MFKKKDKSETVEVDDKQRDPNKIYCPVCWDEVRVIKNYVQCPVCMIENDIGKWKRKMAKLSNTIYPQFLMIHHILEIDKRRERLQKELVGQKKRQRLSSLAPEMELAEYHQHYEENKDGIVLRAEIDISEIEKGYPHIMKKFIIFWGSKEFHDWCEELFVQDRDGKSREGFAMEALDEISLLRNIHYDVYNQYEDYKDIWRDEFLNRD